MAVPVAPTLGGAEPTCAVTTGSITLTPTSGSTYSFDLGNYVAYPSGGWTGLAALSAHTVSEKNSDGCTSPNASRTIARTLAVPVAPTLGGAEPTCAVTTGSITLTATSGSTYKFDGGNYVAYPSGGWTGLAANSTHNVSEKNSDGCTSPNASRTIARTLAVPLAPTLGGAEPTCTVATGSITLSPVSTSTYSFDGGDYVAYPSGGWTGLAASSQHTVSEKNSDGCTSPNASRTLIAQPLSPSFKVCVVQPTLCSTGSMTINATGGTGFLYTINGTDPTAGNTSNVFNNLGVGSVTTIKVKNSAGCSATPVNCADIVSDCLAPAARLANNTATVKTADITEKQTTIKAYPNPFSDKVKFVVTSTVSGTGNLEVYNTMGQKIKTVYAGLITEGTHAFELSLPVKNANSLVYILRIGDKKMTGKLLQMNR